MNIQAVLPNFNGYLNIQGPKRVISVNPDTITAVSENKYIGKDYAMAEGSQISLMDGSKINTYLPLNVVTNASKAAKASEQEYTLSTPYDPIQTGRGVLA